jgi:GTP-binding protein Era
MTQEPYRCGLIALVGRPNVGKSTLLNALIGQKLAITSSKPQTTRHRLRGIHTDASEQIVFIDTPGFQTLHGNALNRAMNRAVVGALAEAHAALLVVEAGRFGAEDLALVKLVPAGLPLLVVVNKIDTVEPPELLPFLKTVAEGSGITEILPVSARRGKGLAAVTGAVRPYLPQQAAIYPEDDITDRNERFLAAEIIREKLFRSLGDELPYTAHVEIENFEERGSLRRIHAAIVLEREGHKAIVIGTRGEKLKSMATAARLDMEKLFGGKVYLEVWVKVRPGWTESESGVKRIGYG